MPSAGRMAWNTSCWGMCTTNRHSEVRVRTLTSTLTPNPENALVSPRTQNGTAKDVSVRASLTMGVLLSGGGCSGGGSAGGRRRGRGQDAEEVVRGGDPAEDAALGRDHVEPDPLVLGEVRAH